LSGDARIPRFHHPSLPEITRKFTRKTARRGIDGGGALCYDSIGEAST
jgi:hypothetical protein